MRIITFNANGIRSAARKGFYDWLPGQAADVVCLQELKAQPDQLTDVLFHPPGYHAYWHAAERRGYSGVGLYARRAPDRVIEGLGLPEFDAEGRYLEAQFGRLSVISLYLPSGSAGEHRQTIKFAFMEAFLPHLQALRADGRQYIVCGDWNIAHTERDLKNWRSNQKNSGFLPEERAWLTRLFDEVGFVDAFRLVNQAADEYTWWSNRGRARENNVGWRIDYQIVSPELAPAVRAARVYRDEFFSDHAPLVMDYDLDMLRVEEPRGAVMPAADTAR
ncbi:MAG: exodeoxyribonuclease III [Pseudomonadota bacterium]|nr:exodeoxyribonuclease III [Pseudomonadota bacterium]HJO35644.1 exodeoxyribonuclease III [Gammaproteobacteria bacterium]